ncbi:MAG: hypothetical protein K9K79_11735 [Desulfohalobiaceae bacterium]|nr:hypothetical protein [Desulfohalobiaceae bacterium]
MPDEATRKRLQDMKQKIDHIERLAHELRNLGQSVPVVEQNVLTLLSTVYVLKFGISDVAEINE